MQLGPLLDAATVAFVDVLWRAGGGEGGFSGGGGFSSGGGGGFSGGSSWSSSSGSSGDLADLGAGGILIFGGIGAFMLFMFFSSALKSFRNQLGDQFTPFTGAGGHQASTMLGNVNAGRVTDWAHVVAGLEAIKRRDPAFNEQDFLSDVNRAFFVIQQAWTERQPGLSRQVMHDGIWNQHKFQIDAYLSQNKQNVLENLAIQNTNLVAVDTDEAFDTVVVRFFASCADYDIDLSHKKQKIIKGDRQIRHWAEDWVFQRSAKATTKPNQGTMNQRCPNCGAPLDLDLAGTCKYCRAPVMSGEFDWVLTRIEQLPSYEYARQTLPG